MIRFEDIEYASLSDVGVRRSHNQDSLATLPANDLEQWHGRGHVFVVADGMGAHAVGELASKLAADSIPHIYSKHAHEGPLHALRKAFVETNLGIHTRGQQNREFAGMGTTGTALVIRPEGVWIGHVGDSRCYRVRKGKVQQLSFDHSLVWELAKRQNKAPEELVGVPTNVIVRSLGPEPIVQVDVEGPHPVQAGDYYLLCSDGLSGQVSDREIGAVMTTLPPDEACRFLINLANLQGGPDNITVIVVHVRGAGGDTTNDVQDQDQPTPPRPSFLARMVPILKKLPWPYVLMGLGIGLSFMALHLYSMDMRGDILTLSAGALAFIAGLAWLMVQQAREAKVTAATEAEGPVAPRVYRETACGIELPVVLRLVQAVETLEERIKEKNWQVSRDACQTHRDRGRQLQKQGDLFGAFREDCRAMLLLMEAISKQRNKEESFKPLWDKDAPPNGRGGK